jgi:hypothetical protein
VKDPLTGINVASSPNDCLLRSLVSTWFVHDRCSQFDIIRRGKSSSHMTKYTMSPTREKLIKIPAGPARCKALPDPTRRPGPMIPASRN